MFGKKNEPNLRIRDVAHLDEELQGGEEGIDSLPFTTGLTPQEVFLLAKCGFEPFQIVVGTIVYSMGLRGVIRSLMRAFMRGEMVDFSHLQAVARDLAIARMRQRADALGAGGVVGVRIDAIQHADFLEVVAMGTAVRAIGHKLSPPGDDLVVPEVVVGA